MDSLKSAADRRGLLFPLVCFLVVLGASSVRAQPKDEAQAAVYREAIAGATSEYDAGSYAEARELLQRAHDIYPNARTLRGLGVACFELKDYVAAVRYLEEALASREKPLAAAMREGTESLLRRAQGYVGTVKISAKPSTTRVTVDGQVVDSPFAAPLRLSVGDHILGFRAPGRLEEQRALSVRGGQTHVVEVQLVDAGLSLYDNRQRSHDDRDTRLYRKWWLWTAVGVAAAGIATGVALALTRSEVIRERPYTTPNTPADAALSTR